VTARGAIGDVARIVRHGPEQLAHPWRLRAAVRRISRRPPPQFVLVVCHGNIYRSPYAAALLRHRLPPLVGNHVRVVSAGFVEPGRSCPGEVLHVAATRGVDLSGHRSRLLVPSDVYAADLVLVMDATQRWGIRALFGRSNNDIIMLGDLDPQRIETREVQDPFSQPKEVLERSYSRIERCIDEVIRAVSATVQRVPDSQSGRPVG